jgi:hypothetical protein
MKIPHTFHERKLCSLNIKVWCGVSQHKIISPIFFRGLVIAECYQEIVMNFISLFELVNKPAGFNKMGLYHIQQLEHANAAEILQ